MALTRTLMACSLLAVGMASVAAGQPSQLRGAATKPPPPPEAPATAAVPQANPPGDVREGYTVVPDTYIEGMWAHVQGPFATAKYWCDYYAPCRGFSQKDGDDQYWWLGTGDYTTWKITRPAPGYTTYLKAASGGASGTSNTSAGHLQGANPSPVCFGFPYVDNNCGNGAYGCYPDQGCERRSMPGCAAGGSPEVCRYCAKPGGLNTAGYEECPTEPVSLGAAPAVEDGVESR